MALVDRHLDAGTARYGTGVDSPMILLIDQARRLVDCTRAAAEMLEQGDPLAQEFGRLTMCRQQDRTGLTEMIRQALTSGTAVLSAGRDAVRIEAVRFGSGDDEPRLLLVCRRREVNPDRHVESVAERFGLTTAERRLLSLLFAGVSLTSAASSLGVARTTARTHLQRIFDKTGSRRQSDLVRMVALGLSFQSGLVA
jgi:DNA-binding CsgD family transcriptional regulator